MKKIISLCLILVIALGMNPLIDAKVTNKKKSRVTTQKTANKKSQTATQNTNNSGLQQSTQSIVGKWEGKIWTENDVIEFTRNGTVTMTTICDVPMQLDAGSATMNIKQVIYGKYTLSRNNLTMVLNIDNTELSLLGATVNGYSIPPSMMNQLQMSFRSMEETNRNQIKYNLGIHQSESQATTKCTITKLTKNSLDIEGMGSLRRVR